MAWTEERVALLTRLWNEGHTATQIADQFGDITRNAVIGKVHRLGLSGRAAETRFRAARIRMRPRNQKPRGGAGTAFPVQGNAALKADTGPAPAWPAPTPARRPNLRPVEQPETEAGPAIGLLDLKENSCRWPIGEPDQPGFGFCGCHKAEHGPYCERHAAMAFQPAARRRAAEKEAA
jgi:GcrA cell cycle regulator